MLSRDQRSNLLTHEIVKNGCPHLTAHRAGHDIGSATCWQTKRVALLSTSERPLTPQSRSFQP